MFKLEKKEKYLLCSICLLVIIFLVFPVFVGEDSIISIHDNLDSNAAWAKVINRSNSFFTLNSPTSSFNNLSSLYFMQVNYSLYSALFCLLPTFTAYMINYYIAIIVGFVSMFILLKRLGIKDDFITVVISISFAVLPKYYWSAIAISSMPILGITFLDIIRQNTSFNKKYMLLLFFPLISSFVFVGIFALGLWFFASLVVSIKKKKLNLNLLIGFIVLSIGYVLVELKLFYCTLIVKTPLNRNIFNLASGHILYWFKCYFVNGFYHFGSLQRYIIMPICTLFILSYGLSYVFSPIKRFFNKLEKNSIRLIVFLFGVILFFSFVGGLYESKIVQSLLATVLPPLSGFNWGRIWILNVPLWYILFAFVVVQINSMFDKKWVGYTVVLLQLCYVLCIPAPYNDNIKTWYNEIFYKTGFDKVLRIDKTVSKKFADGSNDFISYKEFFDVALFEEIKHKIKYANENVVAFGYHPSVLMYNGFHTVDGYNSTIPLSYMRQFGRLLGPEFAVNHEMRDYYNSWGGRMYLYNGGHNFYEPTRDKNPKPATLRVDMNILKDTFNVKYILSRVEISNAAELRLHLLGSYTHNNSIYTIHVYEVL